MTEKEVVEAIHANHLKANISGYEAGADGAVIHWERAWIDPGGTIFGPGPYAKVPITIHWTTEALAALKTVVSEASRKPVSEIDLPDFPTEDEIVIRVYPPERLRARLAKAWRAPDPQPEAAS